MDKYAKQLLSLKEQERRNREEAILIARKRREIMTRLHNNGMTYQQIADVYGVKDRRRVEWIVKNRKAKQ